MSTPESFEEQITRVHAMAHDANGEAWQLGGTDRAALLAVLESHRELLDSLKTLHAAVVRHGSEEDDVKGFVAFGNLMAALRAAADVIAKAEGR